MAAGNQLSPLDTRPQGEGVAGCPEGRRQLGAVPEQHSEHGAFQRIPSGVYTAGVKSRVKKRSRFSRREAMRTKILKAVSLKAIFRDAFRRGRGR